MFDTWIGRLVNLGMLVVLALVATNLGLQRFGGPPAAPPAEVAPGTRVETPGTQSSTAIVLVTASNCQYCTASMPFYTELEQLAADHHVRMIPVAARGEALATNAAYLHAHRLPADRILDLATAKLSVSATPSLFLVSKGVVVLSHRGVLTKDQEAAFKAKVVELARAG